MAHRICGDRPWVSIDAPNQPPVCGRLRDRHGEQVGRQVAYTGAAQQSAAGCRATRRRSAPNGPIRNSTGSMPEPRAPEARRGARSSTGPCTKYCTTVVVSSSSALRTGTVPAVTDSRTFRRPYRTRTNDWYGRTVVAVDRFYPSSKTCSACGRINDSMPLHIRDRQCPCGAVHDRDVNAAKSIQVAGPAVLACKDGVRPPRS